MSGAAAKAAEVAGVRPGRGSGIGRSLAAMSALSLDGASILHLPGLEDFRTRAQALEEG